jgi:SET domain-containing protein
MLEIPVTVECSPIRGLGVFATQRVERGTVIWRFTPGFDLDVDAALLDALHPWQRERLLHYGYIDARLKRYILGCDDARFINHSTQPNLAPDFARGAPYGIDVALRDIEPGEELTIDYSLLEGAAPR